jgi:hypothetical protein
MDTNSSLRVAWLPPRHENSKNLVVNLPTILQNNGHGQKTAAVDPVEGSKFLHLDRDAIDRLTKRFFCLTPKPASAKKAPLDRAALVERWTGLLESGTAKHKADLARQFVTCRAWISKIMRCLPKS